MWATDGSTCTADSTANNAASSLSDGYKTLMFEGEDGTGMTGHTSVEFMGISRDGHPVLGPYITSSLDVFDGTGA